MSDNEGGGKGMVWGLFLIALGLTFLFERVGVIDAPAMGRMWPLVFAVIAVTHFMDRRPGSAVMFLMLGAWFMACTWDWMGLTFRNSWPLALVAVGSSIVVKALSGEDRKRPKGGTAS